MRAQSWHTCDSIQSLRKGTRTEMTRGAFSFLSAETAPTTTLAASAKRSSVRRRRECRLDMVAGGRPCQRTRWTPPRAHRRLLIPLISASWTVLRVRRVPPPSAWSSHSRRSARFTIVSFVFCVSVELPRESGSNMTSTYPTREESAVIAAAEELMVKTMARYDPSHDAFHGQCPALARCSAAPTR